MIWWIGSMGCGTIAEGFHAFLPTVVGDDVSEAGSS